MKKPWLSKTLWANALIALSAFYPPVGAWMAGNADLVLQLLAGLNILLRILTKDKLSLKD